MMADAAVADLFAAWCEDLQGPPRAGYYKVRIVPFGPWVSARVWLDVPRDDEGRVADRPRRLACQVNGQWAELSIWWPRFTEITADEYREIVAHPPADPWARVKPQRKDKADGR